MNLSYWMKQLMVQWTEALSSRTSQAMHAHGFLGAMFLEGGLKVGVCSILVLLGSSIVYVPEEHFLFLVCRHGSDVEWTHGSVRINATKHRSKESLLDQTKYQLLSDGTLYIKDLEETDFGRYYCNGRLVAEVIVLTGESFVVSVGSTLYLPCSFSGKFKQRWAYKHTTASKREYISTLFKNGTLKQERDDPGSRFIHNYNHLHIVNLQLSDSGFYLCNGHAVASVMVISAESTDVENNVPHVPENDVTSVCYAGDLPGDLCTGCGGGHAAVRHSLSEVQKQKKSSRCLGKYLCNIDMFVFAVLTYPNRTPSDEEHSVPLTTSCEIQYASLGRQNWRARGWAQDSGQQVIYSTLLHGPSSLLPNSSITQRV
ncbi:hypothetical protein NFI96_015847 [Prochilodus magdalenae]|nr:hypothetical protein NFI96_015847 [Prochilodus magdalenae]